MAIAAAATTIKNSSSVTLFDPYTESVKKENKVSYPSEVPLCTCLQEGGGKPTAMATAAAAATIITKQLLVLLLMLMLHTKTLRMRRSEEEGKGLERSPV